MIFPHYKQAGSGGRAGFTMVEIALSLAIVGFALVAIIGILPTGMTVQKDNREDTLMGQEGRYWMEAIRSSGVELKDLTNYVEEIRVVNVDPTGNETNFFSHELMGTNFTTEFVLMMLTRPKYTTPFPTNIFTEVTARVRPITGSASDLLAMSEDRSTNNPGFRYELQAEIVPEITTPRETLDALPPSEFAGALKRRGNLGNSLHNVRLVLRYPLRARGNGWIAGNGVKTYHAKIAGVRNRTNQLPTPNVFPFPFVAR